MEQKFCCTSYKKIRLHYVLPSFSSSIFKPVIDVVILRTDVFVSHELDVSGINDVFNMLKKLVENVELED